MNFFTPIAALGQGIDVNLRIKAKNGLLTVMVEPLQANISKLKPLVVTGTPEELDEGFLAQFDGHMTVSRGLSSNLDEVRKDADEIKKDTTAKSERKPDNKTNGDTKGGKTPKSAKKEEKKKTVPSSPEPGDMFSQPPVDEKAQQQEPGADEPETEDSDSDDLNEPPSEPK